MKEDIAGKISDISNRANQIASLACAVSNAAVYAPDSLDTYLDALVLFASAATQLAEDLRAVAIE